MGIVKSLSIQRKRIVGITVKPTLGGFGRGNDRMAARARVLRRVAVRGAIAASRAATGLTGA